MKKRRNRAPKHARPEPPDPSALVEPPEEGLSVDSDELGPSFLRNATEQGNFETARAVASEFAPPVAPPSDDAPRESATPAGSLWERTVEKVSAAPAELDPEKLDGPFEPGSIEASRPRRERK
jgi:hypothetical protein